MGSQGQAQAQIPEKEKVRDGPSPPDLPMVVADRLIGSTEDVELPFCDILSR